MNKNPVNIMAGQIIKRGESKWVVRIFLGRDTEGKRKYFNHTVNGSKKDAQKYLTAKLREKDLGGFVEQSSVSLDEYLDKWLQTTAKPRLRSQTLVSYEYHLKKYVCPSLGKIKMSDLKAAQIQNLYSKMQGAGLGSRVIRYCHSILNSSLSHAVKTYVLSQNPCQAVQQPRPQRREMQVLSPEEAAKFLTGCKNDKHGIVLTFALISGMRPEEYFGLTWRDIDLQKGVVQMQRTVVWQKGGGWHFGEPKTSKSRRSIPITVSLTKELKTHRIKQMEMRLKLGSAYQNFNLVFAADFGTPLHSRNIDQRHFKKILKTAQLNEKLRLYDLRHTCATLLLSAGENPKVVAERLGHASVVLTLDTYSHVLPDMQKAATEKLERMLFK